MGEKGQSFTGLINGWGDNWWQQHLHCLQHNGVQYQKEKEELKQKLMLAKQKHFQELVDDNLKSKFEVDVGINVFVEKRTNAIEQVMETYDREHAGLVYSVAIQQEQAGATACLKQQIANLTPAPSPTDTTALVATTDGGDSAADVVEGQQQSVKEEVSLLGELKVSALKVEQEEGEATGEDPLMAYDVIGLQSELQALLYSQGKHAYVDEEGVPKEHSKQLAVATSVRRGGSKTDPVCKDNCGRAWAQSIAVLGQSSGHRNGGGAGQKRRRSGRLFHGWRARLCHRRLRNPQP